MEAVLKHWVRSDGVELAVREWGEPDRSTVILLHGYPNTSAIWTDVAEQLAVRFHVVAYDVRGAGGSTRPWGPGDAGYAMPCLLDDLDAVIKAVRPDSPVHLVGHGWGALQGWAAVTDPRLSGLIASFTSAGGISLQHLPACLHRLRERGPGGALEAAGQAARSSCARFFLTPILPAVAIRMLGRWSWERALRHEGIQSREWYPAATFERDAIAGLGLYRANRMSGRTQHDEGPVPQVSVPVQIVVCTRDRYLSPELVKAHSECADRAWVRQMPAGHWVQLTHPDLLSQWITEFVDAVDGPAPLRPHRGGVFDGQLVVVTGAGSGIGRATAYGFAANGARVIAADIDEGAAKCTADGIVDRGGEAHAYGVDVADAQAMERFAAWVRDACGVPEVVVNNAGISVGGSLLDTPEDEWAKICAVNLDGVYRGCRLFGRQMVERGQGGHLINVASMAAYSPAAKVPAYSATKAAVLQLSECLRLDLAEHGIGVSAICPGIINTPIAAHVSHVGVTAEEAGRRRERAMHRFAEYGYPPEKVALAIMRAVLRNRPVVPVAFEAHIGLALSRMSPAANRAFAFRTKGWPLTPKRNSSS